MNRKSTSPIQIIQIMTHDSLDVYKKAGSVAPLNKLIRYDRMTSSRKYKNGVVFVSPSKQALSEGKGHIITSYESLLEQYNDLTHWTPNTYRGGTYYDFKNRIIKGHTKENLKQINVIGMDIDTKEVDLYSIFPGCEEVGLPRPNLILETPRGFQLFWILETPFYIHRKDDYKALRVAERLTENMKKAVSKYAPVDLACNPFGFFRIPNDFNIRYFDERQLPANTALLLSWSKTFEKQEKKNAFKVTYSPNASALDYTSSDWYREIIGCTSIQSGIHGSSRNNTLFTLAVANYTSGKEYFVAYDELDQFNSNLDSPLSKREFERTLKSAYSGKYKGVKRSFVESLLETWTNGTVSFYGREGWYKFKKEREERQRSHYDEREQDIIDYLELHTSPETPFLEGSLTKFAEHFKMAVSTLKEVLNRSTKLLKRVIGRGRNGGTMLATKSMLFRSILHRRKEQVAHAQLSLSELFPSSDKILVLKDFPSFEELLDIYEPLGESRAAPRSQLIS